MAILRTPARKGTAAALAAGVLVTGLPAPPASADQPAAEQLYVAPWGKDTWPGTAERPFATPGRAQQAVRARTAGMKADLVVNLRAGTYTLDAPLRLSDETGDSGRNGHRVVYQAHGYGTARQEKVIISGGRRIPGWRPDDRLPGVWRADVGALDTRQLYVDGRRAARPALGKPFPGKVTATKTGYETDSAAPQSWWSPRDMEVLLGFGYAEGRCGVSGISGDARHSVITMDEPCWSLARELYGAEALTGVSDVENSPSFLREPGGWYLDRSRPGHHVLLYLPRPGQDMRRAQVVAPVLESLVTGAGREGRPLHDVGFKGLAFAYATWLAPSEPAGFASAWSMYMRPDGLRTVPGTVAFHRAERLTFEGNTFAHLGAQALEISGNSSHNVVDGNVITDVSDGGILMGVVPPSTKGVNRGNRITNNWINHVGQEYRASSGIWDTATSETTIAHNQVDHVPYSGILTGPSDDLRGIMRKNRVLNNRVFKTNLVLPDGGGIYLRGEQGTSYADGAVIRGNAVDDSKNPEWNVGIYTDDSTNWVTVDRNAVYDYAAAIGGCSEVWGDRPVQNVLYRGNFWDDAVPTWVARREYPGAWPTAEQECGDPAKLRFEHNTLLKPDAPGQACAANAACAAILANAGPLPPYRRTLGIR
ncbi:right-handed parallel beta-helix repeat-containing protein [Actinomadura graeca]|uniref:right-handed parallel beta-helix repeat-containing protein n=1 Tax=Actinomadura graeca TaxID=2750812 RepID=UPI001E31BCD4|nr:right-handed parallel beta-helix repeat-containing protein [Actinomadura graeca]